MERLLQYFDDFDDLFGMLGLVVERLRRVMIVALSYLIAASTASAGIWIALLSPPFALATSILLFVTLLYRSATSAHSISPTA